MRPTTPTFLSLPDAAPPTKPVVYSPVPTMHTLRGAIFVTVVRVPLNGETEVEERDGIGPTEGIYEVDFQQQMVSNADGGIVEVVMVHVSDRLEVFLECSCRDRVTLDGTTRPFGE